MRFCGRHSRAAFRYRPPLSRCAVSQASDAGGQTQPSADHPLTSRQALPPGRLNAAAPGIVPTGFHKSHSPFDSEGFLTSNRYMSPTSELSGRMWPFLVIKSYMGWDFSCSMTAAASRQFAALTAVSQPSAWREQRGLTLASIRQFNVAVGERTAGETRGGQQSAAVRMLFDWLIT